MEVKSSLDWAKVETELQALLPRIKDGRYAMQANKMLRNFRPMINRLGMLELEARRSPYGSHTRLKEHLDKVNQDVLEFEQWITLLMLM